jgi:hypothetical protein
MSYKFVKVRFTGYENDDHPFRYYCDTVEKLDEFFKTCVQVKFDNAFINHLEVVDANVAMEFHTRPIMKGAYKHYANLLAHTIAVSSSLKEKSYIDEASYLYATFYKNCLEYVLKGIPILFNANYTYMPLVDGLEIVEEIVNEKFEFPITKYTEKDIRIIKWDGGTHYYAKIGNEDVVYYGEQKWDNEPDARYAALQYLRKHFIGEEETM